jgi:hypothetical protein
LANEISLPVSGSWSVSNRCAAEKSIGLVSEIRITDTGLASRELWIIKLAAVAALDCR